MSSKLMSADEKRNRKNELARIRRMNAKNIEGKRNDVMARLSQRSCCCSQNTALEFWTEPC